MRLIGVSILVFVLGGVLIGCSSSPDGSRDASEIKSTASITRDVISLSGIELQNKSGNIELKPAMDNQLKINYEKVVLNASKELADELMNHIQVIVRNDTDTVYIETTGMEEKEQIIAKYKEKNVNFSINYVLEIPARLLNFTIKTGQGNICASDLKGSFDLDAAQNDIKLTNLKGSFDLNAAQGHIILTNLKGSFGSVVAGQGNIVINNIIIEGASVFTAGQGSIEAKLAEIVLADETHPYIVDFTTGMSNINLALKKDLKCILEIGSQQVYNNGKVTLRAKSSMGNVNYSFYD